MTPTATTTSQKWTCAGCRVAVGRIDGSPAPLPNGWVHAADGDFCLGCRRQRAGEAALEMAPSDTNRDARVKLRRAGLIEFELRRAPDRPDGSIAKACRASVPAVAAARRQMDAGDQLASAPDREASSN